ncbi:hypothetical protein [Vibrio splendidus]|uniref:hypothetical protein n=1 Tax=Vibrio splendidus TaxID=29497 RepID=UPI0015E69DE1|nr:hypothetical protein [Vibrio splendidus]
MIDKIDNECAELMKNERELLVSIWDAYFQSEGNQGKGKQVQEIKWPPVNHY